MNAQHVARENDCVTRSQFEFVDAQALKHKPDPTIGAK